MSAGAVAWVVPAQCSNVAAYLRFAPQLCCRDSSRELKHFLIHSSGDRLAVGREQLVRFDKTSSIGAHKPIMLGHSGQVYRWALAVEQDKTRGREFFPNLEAARGVAALMVALFHIGLTRYADAFGHEHELIIRARGSGWGDVGARILGNGPGAVIFFFVLSGFVLTKVLESGSANVRDNAGQFLSGRVFRICPGVISTLIVFTFVYLVFGSLVHSPEQFSSVSLFLNALLIRPNIDPVMWSLQLEMIGSVVILGLYYAWLRYGKPAIFLPYFILLALSFTAVWNHLIGSPNSFGQIYAFVSGMAAYVYGRQIVSNLRRPLLWLAFAIVGFASTRPIAGWSSYWTILLETIFGGSIAALLAFGAFRTPSGRLFSIARFFGKISFSFYLLHPIVLMYQKLFSAPVTDAVARGIHPLAICAVLFAASVCFTTPLALVQYQLIEVPFIKLGRGFVKFSGMRAVRAIR
jgi:peptidoglycan/LPS O-acetylase OafA/YrhL